MFRLSQKADYGLILLSNLADAKISISVSAVAQKNQIPSKFLSQIALELKNAGILKSREGKSGGYLLARKPENVKILDVLKILDGELVEGKCFEEGHECVCGAGDMWGEVREKLNETIGKKTVADLVA